MDRESVLLHQVHPVKLATDFTTAALAVALAWRRRPIAALVVAFVPPVVVSAIVLRSDLTRQRDSRRGQYVLRHMPPSAEAVRLLGFLTMLAAGSRRRWIGIVAGAALIAAGWSHGLLDRSSPAHAAYSVLRPEGA